MKIRFILFCLLLSVSTVYANDVNLDVMSIMDLYKQVEAINYDYEELQKAYEDAKANEQSLANRTLTALTVAATGIGEAKIGRASCRERV